MSENAASLELDFPTFLDTFTLKDCHLQMFNLDGKKPRWTAVQMFFE